MVINHLLNGMILQVVHVYVNNSDHKDQDSLEVVLLTTYSLFGVRT